MMNECPHMDVRNQEYTGWWNEFKNTKSRESIEIRCGNNLTKWNLLMCALNNCLPLTLSSDPYESIPAIFEAMHLIKPTCSISTDAIFKTLDFADNLFTVMPFSPDMIGSLFSVHLIWMGKSPLTIIHETPVLSPVLNDSSPNVNGIICGGTALKLKSESGVYETDVIFDDVFCRNHD